MVSHYLESPKQKVVDIKQHTLEKTVWADGMGILGLLLLHFWRRLFAIEPQVRCGLGAAQEGHPALSWAELSRYL